MDKRNRRPHPPVVTPGRPGTQDRAGTSPSDAVVLFDGDDLDAWYGPGKKPARWKVENGYMEVAPKAGTIETRKHFADCQLHLEWSVPPEVKGRNQGRGNSGVFLPGGYEIQILDSYKNVTYADGQAAALYGQKPPAVNACRPPGEWQRYDIIFTAPRFENGTLQSPAVVTMFHNGILVHNHAALIGRTAHKKVASYSPHPPEGPIRLQDHKSPVRFRNIWVRPLD